MDIITSEQMKRIEENSLQYDLTYHRLMENAGSAAAAFIRRTLQVDGRNVMVFCAKGNNGGDGLVVARKLAENGAVVVIVLLDGIPASEAAASMYGMAELMDLPILDFYGDQERLMGFLAQCDLVVDAMCGTGFHGELRPVYRDACRAVNEAICAVVSLDVPTGVECDTGRADPDAVHADFTVTFDSPKPVHVKPDCKRYCGMVEVVDIGIPPEAKAGILPGPLEEFPPPPVQSVPDEFVFQPVEEPSQPPLDTFVFQAPEAEVEIAGIETQVLPQPEPSPAPPPEKAVSLAGFLRTDDLFALLPPRAPDSHKGTYGRLLNLSGSPRYPGAAALSSLGALRCGVGLVTLAAAQPVCAAVSTQLLEAVYLPLPQGDNGLLDAAQALPLLEAELSGSNAVLLGCGLGDTPHTRELLEYLLANATCPVVIDADGLNVLAKHIHLLKDARPQLVLTPHPGEMARLCGVETEQINTRRQAFAMEFAREHKVTLVLKGSGTLIAAPGGVTSLNETGNPGLAKGGSGDILAGMIASFLAQGLSPRDAAACGVHFHGLAADRTALRKGQYSMLPSELLEDLCEIFAENGR